MLSAGIDCLSAPMHGATLHRASADICALIRCRQPHALVCWFPSRRDSMLHRLGVPVLQAVGCSYCIAESRSQPAVPAYLLCRRTHRLCCPMLWRLAAPSFVIAAVGYARPLIRSVWTAAVIAVGSCFCPRTCLARAPPPCWRRSYHSWGARLAQRGACRLLPWLVMGRGV